MYAERAAEAVTDGDALANAAGRIDLSHDATTGASRFPMRGNCGASCSTSCRAASRACSSQPMPNGDFAINHDDLLHGRLDRIERLVPA
jgi:hypothetical protein